jgi:hypothetical protein
LTRFDEPAAQMAVAPARADTVARTWRPRIATERMNRNVPSALDRVDLTVVDPRFSVTQRWEMQPACGDRMRPASFVLPSLRSAMLVPNDLLAAPVGEPGAAGEPVDCGGSVAGVAVVVAVQATVPVSHAGLTPGTAALDILNVPEADWAPLNMPRKISDESYNRYSNAWSTIAAPSHSPLSPPALKMQVSPGTSRIR